MNDDLHTPVCATVDTRTNAEFLRELAGVRALPLVAQLRFMRNTHNRDRALSIPKHTLTKMLNAQSTSRVSE